MTLLYYAAIRRKAHGGEAENSDDPNAQIEVAKVDKSSTEAGYDLHEAGGTGNGQGIERHRVRNPGSRPGTFQSECIICQGKGCMRASGPYNVWNTCLTCGGEGTVVRDGEREGDSDRRTQPTWGDVLWFSLWTAVITAGFCWLLISRAGAH